MPDAPPLRINIGCGAYKLPGFVNLDQDPACAPDLVATVPPLPFPDGAAAEVWLCHVLEHYDYAGGQALLADCARVLAPGGQLGVVVPDTRAILQHWLAADGARAEFPEGHWWMLDDLDDVCGLFLYSTCQPSRHQWSYDAGTLRRALTRAGFRVTGEIDRYADPRLGTGQWFQCGWAAVKGEGA